MFMSKTPKETDVSELSLHEFTATKDFCVFCSPELPSLCLLNADICKIVPEQCNVQRSHAVNVYNLFEK